MGNDKTKLWDRLGKTDPSHTKGFQRAGGFKGTAIKPIYSYRRMTEEFGPCGTDWGIGEPKFQLVPAGDELLVYCTVAVWHGNKQNVVYGVGGDKVITKFSSGLKSDDEAFKKAFTDAITNGLKLIGVGADVHMGLFEDSKYVTALKAEFAHQPEPPIKRENPHVTRAEDIWEDITQDAPWLDVPQILVKEAKPEYTSLIKDMIRNQNVKDLQEWREGVRPTVSTFPPQWKKFFLGAVNQYEIELRNGTSIHDKPKTNGNSNHLMAG